jgi:hypothetical protein
MAQVDIENENGGASRVVVMSAQFTDSDVQVSHCPRTHTTRLM